MSDVDVLIVGGGISGLATASILARQGVSVEVWEKEARPGGKIGTEQVDGYSLENAATMVLNFLPEVRAFLNRTGLHHYKTLRQPTAARYIVHDGRLVAVPTKLGQMVTSPLWSTRGKLRLLAEPFIPRGGDERETVSEFIKRRLGSELLDKAMGPYIAGPLASDPQLANAYACLPRLTALERRYGSLTMGIFAHRILGRRSANTSESFSFAGGMKTVVDALSNDPAINFLRKYGHRTRARREDMGCFGRHPAIERNLQSATAHFECSGRRRRESRRRDRSGSRRVPARHRLCPDNSRPYGVSEFSNATSIGWRWVSDTAAFRFRRQRVPVDEQPVPRSGSQRQGPAHELSRRRL